MDKTSQSLEAQYNNYTVQNVITDTESGVPTMVKDVTIQNVRHLSVTMQILDSSGLVVDTLTGKATGGSVSMDGTSLIRRTGSITLKPEKKLIPGTENSLIWFGHRVKIFVGIDNLSSIGREQVNFQLGIFDISKGDLSVSEGSNTLTVTLNDKMKKISEKPFEEELVIPRDTPLDVAIRLLMDGLGETEYGTFDAIEDTEVIPYEMDIKVGDLASKWIEEIRDLYMNWVAYYNRKGEFEFRKISNEKSDAAAVEKWYFDEGDSGIPDLKISFSESYDMDKIKNSVMVIGGTDNQGFTPSSQVNLTDASSPFNVNAIEKQTSIISDSTLYLTEQTLARARYELFKASNFQETATISTIPIYWLEPFDIIIIKNPITKVKYKYVIDKIDVDTAIDGNMSITAHKLYFATVDYGEAKRPIADAITQGIMNKGWLSLGEERIKACYGISGAGTNRLVVQYVNDKLGGEQAVTNAYYTSKTQVLEIDLADFSLITADDQDGDPGRSPADYLDRVLGHEMVHVVMNDYLSTAVTSFIPVWFREGFAELIHGGKDRYDTISGYSTGNAKKAWFQKRAKQILDGAWDSSSTDYAVAYTLAASIYFALSADEWSRMFTDLRFMENPQINFTNTIIKRATSDDEAKQIILDSYSKMPIWTQLNDPNETDTLSIGGYYMMNLYGIKLDAHGVFNNANATTPTIGFKLSIVK